MNKHDKKIVIVGGGVSGACAATKLVDNGYPGELITIIDMGKDPYNRKPEEVMSGWLGCGGWSDGKLTRHHQIGGHLSKYVGEKRAYELMDESINLWKRYHPKPSEMMYSNPTEEPDFIKPYFNLRLFGVHHIGTDYLHEIGKNWYDDLVSKGVNFKWEQKVTAIDFKRHKLTIGDKRKEPYSSEYYDKLIFAVGKSGIDFGKQLEDQYKFETEPKPVQIGVRFEAPQHHFQKLIDISYDFKLYKKFEEERVSLRSFCTNNNAAYVALEETYGDYSYNGHAKKDESFRNDMTNFGILMQIHGIENPFEWTRNVTKKLQKNGKGLFYSPSRKPSLTSEGERVPTHQVESLDVLKDAMGEKYAQYLISFIEDLKKVFPTLQDDYGVYMPEVKYLNSEVKIDHDKFSILKYPNVYFTGDALSARGITVSGSHGVLAAESIIKGE